MILMELYEQLLFSVCAPEARDTGQQYVRNSTIQLHLAEPELQRWRNLMDIDDTNNVRVLGCTIGLRIHVLAHGDDFHIVSAQNWNREIEGSLRQSSTHGLWTGDAHT